MTNSNREFKKAEEALKKAKKDAELHGNSWKQREQELETLKLEVQELENAVTASRQQLEETSQAAQQLLETFEAAKQEHARTTVGTSWSHEPHLAFSDFFIYYIYKNYLAQNFHPFTTNTYFDTNIN